MVHPGLLVSHTSVGGNGVGDSMEGNMKNQDKNITNSIRKKSKNETSAIRRAERQASEQAWSSQTSCRVSH